MIRTMALSHALGAMALTACSFEHGILSSWDASVPDGPASAPGPSILRPAMGQVLPPTRAFCLWQDAEAAAGRPVKDYETCSTTAGMDSIDSASECPGSLTVSIPHRIIDPLTAGTSYLWKVRARFDDGQVSEWSAIQTYATDDSLIAWWRFNGNASDSGTMGINGALRNGAGFAPGLDAQSLQVDGSNDYADMGNAAALHLPGPLTISAWVNGDGLPSTSDTGILNLGTLNYALTYHTDGAVYYYIGDGGNNLSAPMSPNAWHQAVGVFDGTTNAGGMKLYLDNALVGTRASGLATTGATGALWIGRYDMSYFRGLIDNVTIYNRALTDADVLNEYCAAQAAGGVDPLPASCQP
ncbi:MAG TPA: LamG domain-containing protein [bacterium]|nr:LamG domain-containing protein [bacterium]